MNNSVQALYTIRCIQIKEPLLFVRLPELSAFNPRMVEPGLSQSPLPLLRLKVVSLFKNRLNDKVMAKLNTHILFSFPSDQTTAEPLCKIQFILSTICAKYICKISHRLKIITSTLMSGLLVSLSTNIIIAQDITPANTQALQ